jgi:3,4-dihydroxy 2-butanone 4-phosphate synthase/GTP cyclohydrolase II
MPPWIPPLTDSSPVITIPTQRPERSCAAVVKAAEELRSGRPVIVIGGEHGNRTGQLIFAAELVTPATVAFAVRHTSGILCTPMTNDDCDRLDLPAMLGAGRERGVDFTVSVDALAVESTGISATDRACTIAALAGRDTAADAFTRPGHVFPVRTVDGGVLVRPGHHEAAVDLTRIAELRPVAVSATLVSDDGSVSRPALLRRFANEQRLQIITVDDVVAYRLAHEIHVVRRRSAAVQWSQGAFTVVTYTSDISNHQIAAIVHGDIVHRRPIVRYHRECSHGSLFGAPLCTCAEQLDVQLRAIANAESGVLMYTSSLDACPPSLIERIDASQNLGSVGIDFDDFAAPDRHVSALTDHVLRELGVSKPTTQLLMPDPSRSLTWVPSR